MVQPKFRWEAYDSSDGEMQFGNWHRPFDFPVDRRKQPRTDKPSCPISGTTYYPKSTVKKTHTTLSPTFDITIKYQKRPNRTQ